MVCLNLPANMCYKPENIYLAGIILSPHKPSINEVNHFLCPLIDELLGLWQDGVKMTRTASSLNGYLICAAIIPLIADLPAMRKVAGFVHYAKKAHFFSFCPLNLEDINELDHAKWM